MLAMCREAEFLKEYCDVLTLRSCEMLSLKLLCTTAEHTLGDFIQQLLTDGRSSSSCPEQWAGHGIAACRVSGSPTPHLACSAPAWAGQLATRQPGRALYTAEQPTRSAWAAAATGRSQPVQPRASAALSVFNAAIAA